MITSVSQVRSRNTTTVTVVSDLTGDIFYHWYLDGVYASYSTTPVRTFVTLSFDQFRIEVLDTNDPAFDPVANAPAGYPARRTLTFIRSLDATITRYRIEQQKNGGAWTLIGFVQHDPSKWNYEFLSPRLDDLTHYAWRVIPIDTSGNTGTAVSLSSELIVRAPDAPDFTATFSSGTLKVTFA